MNKPTTLHNDTDGDTNNKTKRYPAEKDLDTV